METPKHVLNQNDLLIYERFVDKKKIEQIQGKHHKFFIDKQRQLRDYFRFYVTSYENLSPEEKSKYVTGTQRIDVEFVPDDSLPQEIQDEVYLELNMKKND
jgi:hypothetical protein